MTTQAKVIANALSKVNTKVTVATNPYGGQCGALIDKIVQEETGKNMAYTNAIDTVHQLQSAGAVHLNLDDGDFNRFLESQKFDDEKLVASVQALEKAIKQ